MKYIIIVLALTFSFSLAAQDISRESVAKDLQRIVSAMETYHCNAYHYADSTKIAKLRDALIAALPEVPTKMEAYRVSNLLTCAFGDGHTRVWDYGIAEKYQKTGGTYFPFAVDAYEGKLIIRADYRNYGSELTGTRIMSINGVTAATLIAEMSRHASRETAALDLVLLSGNFRLFLWLTYPWATGKFTISLANGQDHIIPGMTAAAIAANQPSVESRPAIEIKNLKDNTAYLRIDHFEGRPKTFKQRFREAFAQINASGATQLILDLRNHGGGDSRVGEELARYLSDHPFRQFAYSQWKATPQFKSTFKKLYLPKPVQWFLPVIKGVNPHTKAIYSVPDHELARVEYSLVKPYGQDKAFNGEVILLMDNNTFSAGTCFAAMFKDYGMGTIVGQESGNLANFHADGLLRMALLNQTLSLQISNSYLVRPNGDESPTAVQPDVKLSRELDALGYVLEEMRVSQSENISVK